MLEMQWRRAWITSRSVTLFGVVCIYTYIYIYTYIHVVVVFLVRFRWEGVGRLQGRPDHGSTARQRSNGHCYEEGQVPCPQPWEDPKKRIHLRVL